MPHEHRALAAIAGLVGLEAWALYLGVNGTVLSLVVAALAGLGGYTLAKATGAKAHPED